MSTYALVLNPFIFGLVLSIHSGTEAVDGDTVASTSTSTSA